MSNMNEAEKLIEGWRIARLLRIYYEKCFPFSPYSEWLLYGIVESFQNREFTFVNQSNHYKRYQSMETIEEFKRRIIGEIPFKIDLGAIYRDLAEIRKVQSKEKKIKKIAIAHELVFDIDANDYDEVRTCCSGKNICQKCWKYIALGCDILQTNFERDFGFKNILWVFSGRRGIHAWVCDDGIRDADEYIRRLIATHLQLFQSSNSRLKKNVYLPKDKLEYTVQRALAIIMPKFLEICIEDQQLLEQPQHIEMFLRMIPEEDVRTEVRTRFAICTSSIERWNTFLKYVEGDYQLREDRRHLVEEIMLQYCYLRLDIPVTCQMKHLLKSPFSMHPKTLKIAIPIHPKRIHEFDIENTPTVTGLANQSGSKENKKMFEMFHQSTEVFEEFVASMRGNQGDRFRKDFEKRFLTNIAGDKEEFLKGAIKMHSEYIVYMQPSQSTSNITPGNTTISSEDDSTDRETIEAIDEDEEDEETERKEKELLRQFSSMQEQMSYISSPQEEEAFMTIVCSMVDRVIVRSSQPSQKVELDRFSEDPTTSNKENIPSSSGIRSKGKTPRDNSVAPASSGNSNDAEQSQGTSTGTNDATSSEESIAIETVVMNPSSRILNAKREHDDDDNAGNVRKKSRLSTSNT